MHCSHWQMKEPVIDATVLEHGSLQVKSERMVDNELEDGSSTRQVDTSHWPVVSNALKNSSSAMHVN